VGDGVGVGAGGYGGEFGRSAGPADEGVADGVFADEEAFGGGEILEPGAGAEVVLGEDDAGDGGAGGIRLDAGEGGEGLEFAEETGFVDVDLYGARLLLVPVGLRGEF